jgi:hypothetical protein
VPDHDGTTGEDCGHRSLPACQRSNGASARLAGTRVWKVQSEGSIVGARMRAAAVSPMPFTLRINPHRPLNVRQWDERSTPEIPYSWIRSHGLPLCRRALEVDSLRFLKEFKRLRLPIGTRRRAHVSSSGGLTFQADIRHMGSTHFEKTRIGPITLPGEAAFQHYRRTDCLLLVVDENGGQQPHIAIPFDDPCASSLAHVQDTSRLSTWGPMAQI